MHEELRQLIKSVPSSLDKNKEKLDGCHHFQNEHIGLYIVNIRVAPTALQIQKVVHSEASILYTHSSRPSRCAEGHGLLGRERSWHKCFVKKATKLQHIAMCQAQIELMCELQRVMDSHDSVQNGYEVRKDDDGVCTEWIWAHIAQDARASGDIKLFLAVNRFRLETMLNKLRLAVIDFLSGS